MALYDLLSPKDKKMGEIIELDKNNFIFYEDEICKYVYFLLDGEVVISSSDIEGNEEVYNHLYKGDIFGNVLIFADKNKYLGNGVAIKNRKGIKWICSNSAIVHYFGKNKPWRDRYRGILDCFYKEIKNEVEEYKKM